MKLLVTGGAGFVGSNFVRRVVCGEYPGLAGADLVVLDKLTYAGTLSSLDPVLGDPRVRFVHGDVCDAELLDEVLRGVSLVVHCAAETHVDRSIADGSDFVASNVSGTFCLFDRAMKAGVAKFVHVSTDEVYGEVESGSWRESAPLEPNSPYAASKGAADLLARAFYQTYGFPVCITRCGNNYGPYQFPEKLIPLFITNLLDGEPVPLYGDGRNVREWVHVDDHCDAIALVAERGRPGQYYNVGSSAELSNEDVTALLLAELRRDRSHVRYVADRQGHDRRYSVDYTKIRNELGYGPATDFRAGLSATVRWYAEHRSWWEPLKKKVSAGGGETAGVL